MAETTEQTKATPPEASKKPILRCGECGATYRRLKWSPGMKCPKCGSQEFMPVAIIGGAIDYTLADRSHGYALEDIRFAQLAKWSGLITPNQYTQALSRQRQIGAEGGKTPHIAQVLINEGIMNTAETSAVFSYMCLPRPDDEDNALGNLAIEKKWATTRQVKECMDELAMMSRARHEVPPLVQLLFEKRIINENQVLALCQLVNKRKFGPKFYLNRFYEENRELTAAEKIMGTKDQPERRRAFYIFSTLFILALVVWGHAFFGDQGDKIWYLCENPDCKAYHKPFLGEWNDVFPAECPVCHKKTLFCARKCMRCGALFGAAGWWGQYTCPVCHRSNTRPYDGS